MTRRGIPNKTTRDAKQGLMAVYRALGGPRGVYRWVVADETGERQGMFYREFWRTMVPRQVEGKVDHTHRALPPEERDRKLEALVAKARILPSTTIEVATKRPPEQRAFAKLNAKHGYLSATQQDSDSQAGGGGRGYPPISTGGGGGDVNGTRSPTAGMFPETNAPASGTFSSDPSPVEASDGLLEDVDGLLVMPTVAEMEAMEVVKGPAEGLEVVEERYGGAIRVFGGDSGGA